MTIAFRCTHCTKEYRVADQWGGKPAKCQNCGQRLVVPQPVLAAASPQANTSLSRLLDEALALCPQACTAAGPVSRKLTSTPIPTRRARAHRQRNDASRPDYGRATQSVSGQNVGAWLGRIVQGVAALGIVAILAAGVAGWITRIQPIRSQLAEAERQIRSHKGLENAGMVIPLCPTEMPDDVKVAGLVTTQIMGSTFRGRLQGVYQPKTGVFEAVADLTGKLDRNIVGAKGTISSPGSSIAISHSTPGGYASAVVNYRFTLADRSCP